MSRSATCKDVALWDSMTTCCPNIKYEVGSPYTAAAGRGAAGASAPSAPRSGATPAACPCGSSLGAFKGMRAGPRSPVSLGAAEPPRGPFCPLRGYCCRLPWSTPALPCRRQPPLRGGAPAPRGGHRCAPRLRPLPARGRLRLRPRPCGGRPVRRRRRVRPCFAPGSHAPPSAPLRAPRHLGGAGALTRGHFSRAGLQPGPPQPPQAAAL